MALLAVSLVEVIGQEYDLLNYDIINSFLFIAISSPITHDLAYSQGLVLSIFISSGFVHFFVFI